MTGVVALMGLPGAGKSVLARALAEQLRWPIVDRDAFSRARFDAAAKQQATEAAFDEIALRLSRAQSCILDGMTFADAAQRRQLRDLAQAGDASAWFLFLECPVAVAVSRVAAQSDHPALDRNEALVRDVARRFAPAEKGVIRLDATLPPATIAAAALRLLR